MHWVEIIKESQLFCRLHLILIIILPSSQLMSLLFLAASAATVMHLIALCLTKLQ